ncbi:nuclear pore complex subunit Nup133, putative [Aspergillus fumigatus A1163]|uniref:Nuclear pore complex subunit Nup133, putative n=1 Tax=Aspergillus fumigatus (strain CBS 144.89 / FGSC A1163 / CEA10) TaxID=451804 RepID=B0Y5C5_ASPFC|nr:nuclear pore complex subunit Nup133, putative [Aspergillus fumigatus A1163]
MFVPKAGLSSVASLRNPRRRQRTSSDESMKQPDAKRQRSALRSESPGHSSEAQSDFKKRLPKHPGLDTGDVSDPTVTKKPGVQKSLPVRSLNELKLPPNEVNTTVVLSKTDFYTVSQLPAFPDQIRGLQSGKLWTFPSKPVIIYWETISHAGSLGLPRQKQSGLQGHVPGLLPSEYVTDVINCEPSGVIVTFSSGRVAHITFRDSQGRPTVMANFLRNSSSSSGLLNGIKSVFSGGCWRKDVAAVKAARSHQRGQRDIIVGTTTGVFEIWDTHWSNGSIMKKQFDIRQDLCRSLGRKHTEVASDTDLKILDFALLSCGDNAQDLQHSGAESWRLCLVVAPSRETGRRCISVVQLLLSEEVHVLAASSIDLSFSTLSNAPQPNIKLHVATVSQTAFIVIDQSVLLLSLGSYGDSPTSQLLLDSGRLPSPFNDHITFRSGADYKLLGSGCEDETGEGSSSACLVMVRNFGVIRIAVRPRQSAGNEIEDAQITAKTKIEQAVFYGARPGNPLDLTDKGGFDFSPQEIEEAALEICGELLRSTSHYIPATSVTLEQNLKLRAKALDDLASLLLQHKKPLHRQTWYELLWGAEKLAAQRALWKSEDKARRAMGQGNTFLAHVIGSMNEKFKTKSEDYEDKDNVRDWFLFDTFRMEHIIPWIFKALKLQKGISTKQGRRVLEEIVQASELSLAVLETAFRFRDEHARQYGLEDEHIEDGVLSSGYDGLSEFWTSRDIVFLETGHLLDLELDTCRAWTQQATTSLDLREQKLVRQIAENSARQLRVLSLMHYERVRWLSSQDNPKSVDEGIELEQTYTKQRRWQLFKLAGIGQLEDAISLAEKFRDMSALVELIIELQDQTLADSEHAENVTNYESEQLGRRISTYFEKFGEPWADAFFTRQISMGQSEILFTMRRFQPFINRFLHKNPTYARLCWINDAIGEDNYEAAARSLETLALERESDLWCHRVELSLSKLATLAAWEESSAAAKPIFGNEIKRLEDLAELDAVQEVVYAYMMPALQGAIDQKAETELAIDQFGRFVNDTPSLHEVLSALLTKVISRQILRVDQLVDLLTLIDGGQVSEETQNEFIGKEFYLALRVIRLNSSTQEGPLYCIPLQKLVWRRCMIRDDWQLEKNADNTDHEPGDHMHCVSLLRTLTLCLRDKHCADADPCPLYVPSSPLDVVLNESDLDFILSSYPQEQRNRICRDLSKENDILLQRIEEGKLEFWYRKLLISAEEAVSSSASHSTGALVQFSDGLQAHHSETGSPSTRAQLSWL